MNIKFILDRFRERDRKQLELIKKIINEKPNKVSQDARFLRKFTLAILHQYNKNLVPRKINVGKVIHKVPSKINLDFKMLQAPSPAKLDFRLEVPKKIEL